MTSATSGTTPGGRTPLPLTEDEMPPARPSPPQAARRYAPLIALLALAAWAAPARADAACTRYASAAGSDAGPGTRAAPFRTTQRLVDALGPGQTGCLVGGRTYPGDVRFKRGGAPGAPLTLTSAPGTGRATVRGKVYVPDGSDDVVITGLILNGAGAGRVSPSVNGDRVVIADNEITNDHTAICLHLGSNVGHGIAEDVLVERNRIHRCGRLPATNHDHGIYVNSTRNARIVNNWIHDNADFGVHLYPNAQGTYVAHNVIDGNGEGVTFSGGEAQGYVSNHNRVVNNIITNSRIRWNIESWWQDRIGVGNRAEGNCVFGGRWGDIAPRVGFTAVGNIVADPLYVDRPAKDFRLRPGSPCAGKGPVATDLPPPVRAVPARPPRPAPASGAKREAQRAGPVSARADAMRRRLVINRRIAAAALRRALRAEARTLGGSPKPLPPAARRLSPRATASEMRATQRLAQEALRRSNAALARLTGRRGPVPRRAGPVGRVRMTPAQLRIDQRIAQAAIRRTATVERLLAAAPRK